MHVLLVTISWAVGNPKPAPYITQQVKFLRRVGIEADIFCFRGNKTPINYLHARREFREVFNSRRFDLIHAHSGQSGLIVLPTSAPLVVTFNGSDLLGIVNTRGYYTLAGTVLRAASKFVARFAKEIIVVSSAMAKYLPNHPLHVIPHGVDLDLFLPGSREEARQKLGLPAETNLVLFSGDPSKSVKRFDLAQSSVALVSKKMALRLIVASGVPHEMMPLYMNACDALLLTSRHEGSPNPVKEAIACRMPVVSIDVGDVRQRIGHLQGCVVCADDRPETIATALELVLQKRQRIHSYTTADFDQRLLTDKVVSVYSKALSAR